MLHCWWPVRQPEKFRPMFPSMVLRISSAATAIRTSVTAPALSWRQGDFGASLAMFQIGSFYQSSLTLSDGMRSRDTVNEDV